MLGSQLVRYDKARKFLTLDTEASGLNLYTSLPWEISYIVATLGGGVESVATEMIYWPNYQISEDAARISHFDRAKYEAEAKPAREVWDRFGPLLYSPDYQAVGHNLIGYDFFVISNWARALGLTPDNSYIYRPLLDTNALSKARIKQWIPDISSPSAFLAFQYKCYHWIEKGLKSSIGAVCGELGIEYDKRSAHGSLYDAERTFYILKELVWQVEF